MLTFFDARQRIVEAASPLPVEEIAVEQVLDRVLARDIASPRDLPSFDYSAMDGYAVRTRDFPGPPPFTAPIVGESRAGLGWKTIEPHSACRIFTGAPLPEGTDAIVAQEDTERDGGRLKLLVAPGPGRHIRRRGDDLKRGELALGAGVRVGPHQLGLLVALGLSRVAVHRQPVVSILATGDELTERGAPEARVSDSNSFTVGALARRSGARVVKQAVLADDLAEIRGAVSDLLAQSDLVITIGGVSVGERDVVKQALTQAGVALDFWRVAVRPGKPLVFGRANSGAGHPTRALVLGLPGNPASAALTFTLFGLPLLRKLQGTSAIYPVFERAVMACDLLQAPGRRGFYRAQLIETDAGLRAQPFDNQASGSVVSFAWANGLVMVPEDSHGLRAGETAEVLRLDRA